MRPPSSTRQKGPSVPVPPPLGPEQRRRAQDQAAQARAIRAQVKQLLASGDTTLGELLDRVEGSEPLARMRVSEVLESLPRMGRVRTRRIMEDIGIARTRRLRGLGRNQRRALLERFDP
jgi:hypothetical protein